MKSFKQLHTVKEEKKDYQLVILTAHDEDDPNTTAVLLKDTAKKMGIKCHLIDFKGMYISEKAGQQFINAFETDKEGKVIQPTLKDSEADYLDPIPINPEDTLIMCRGLGDAGVTSNSSWTLIAKDLEHQGYTLINSVQCHDICKDKLHNLIYFERNNIPTPSTVRVRHVHLADRSFKQLNTDFPIILKTATGSQGVGIVLIESASALNAFIQLIHKQNEYVSILLQEFVESEYDIRAIVCNGEVVGAMKRPVVEGDFRSNVAQGSIPESIKLTEIEVSECLRAADAVEGKLVGVDFFPAVDREKDQPLFIEVNSVPGLNGIEEVSKGIVKKILESFKNKQNWQA